MFSVLPHRVDSFAQSFFFLDFFLSCHNADTFFFFVSFLPFFFPCSGAFLLGPLLPVAEVQSLFPP